jgi:hypothetical protein
MNRLNLVLKFRLAGHDQYQIKGASRIKVDGRGGLTFYDVQSGSNERLDLQQLRHLSLHTITQAQA